MIIRKLTAEEDYKKAIVCGVAFEFSLDYEKTLKGDDKSDKPDSVNGFNTETIAGFSDDEKIMYGCMDAIPYEIRYDGNTTMMLGIGGVATLPPYRRNGVIRECFKQFFKDCREKGVMFSYLYPFSRSYYRKFGYESNTFDTEWEIDLKALKQFGIGGRTELLMPEDDYSVLDKIYTEMYKNHNMSVVRKKSDYDYFTNRDSFANQRYAYVWYNENDEPKAFIMFKKLTVDGKNIMDCTHKFPSRNELVFADIEGLKGILDFTSAFAANYDSIRFALPSDLRIEGLISEGNFSRCNQQLTGMVRVINVEDVLKASRYNGTGSACIKIADRYIEENNAVFSITFKDGSCVDIKKGTGNCDAEMDIATFSTLIIGSYPDINSCLKEDIVINGNLDELNKIFYSKKNRIVDLF